MDLRVLYRACLIDAWIRLIVTLLIGMAIGVLVMFFVGCDTPYTGFLGPGDIDGYLEGTSDDTVCLNDGFDSVCIKMIPGLPGKDGKDGKDGVSIVGPQGPQGEDGERGRRGFPGRRGKNGAIVVVETPYLLLETPSASFTMMISHGIPEVTSDTYVTPVATVEVPVGGGRPSIRSKNKPVEVSPVVADPPVVGGDDIWHVMYRNEGGRVSVFVYPRAVLDPVTVNLPPDHVSGDTHGIGLDTVSDVGRGYNIEMQGDRESVRDLLDRALSEDNATLGSVGGVQGVVN